MDPRNLFWKEVLEDVRSPHSLLIKFLLPLIFILPLVLPAVPPAVKSGMLPLAALFLGVFGSSIGLVRMKESGMAQRLAMLPRSPRRMLSEYVLANVAMDTLQLAIPLAATVVLLGLDAGASFLSMAILISAVVASNSVGAVVAISAGSSGEVHLYAAISILAIGGASGLFMPGISAGAVTMVSPFSALSAVLANTTGGWLPGMATVVVAAVSFLAAVGMGGRVFGR